MRGYSRQQGIQHRTSVGWEAYYSFHNLALSDNKSTTKMDEIEASMALLLAEKEEALLNNELNKRPGEYVR